jgi:prolyl oligopeptidase
MPASLRKTSACGKTSTRSGGAGLLASALPPWLAVAILPWLAVALLPWLAVAALPWLAGPGALALAGETGLPSPPQTARKVIADTLHGVVIEDPYRWLEDQESPETRDWINRQNRYTQSILTSMPDSKILRQEFEGLMRTEDIGIPTHRNGRYFFTRRLPKQDLDVIYVRYGPEGEDRVLVDPHSLSPDHEISVDLINISDDGRLLVYGLRRGGEDEIAVRILDIDSGEHMPDSLPRARYWDIAITPDNSGFYYGVYGEEGDRVYHHRFGTAIEEDKMLFGDGYGPEMGIGLDLSEEGRYLLFSVHHGSAARKTELYFMDLEADDGIETIVNDVDARFTGLMGDGKLFMQTDWEAPHGRILVVDLENPGRENWKQIVPESDATIRRFTLAGGKLLVSYLLDVIPTVAVIEPDGETVTNIRAKSIGWVSSFYGRWQDDEAFYSFSAFHIPNTIYRYDLASLTQTVWAREEAPIRSNDFEVEQVWYESRDGTRVPMFLTHPKNLELDGTNPVLLTGYGGFRGISLPYFSSLAALWLKMGGVYAVPCLRGGGEFGEEWHRAGMLEQKQNTFDDFIGAAEWLVEEGYTNPDRLAIRGGSNGGLLVGAALVQRPDLFEAVICTYPLLDMVRFHRFLVARWWVPEYGSAEDPDQFRYIYEYSPYHNVEPGTDYPAVLFVTGDSDTRVAPLHARKMTALLQHASTGKEPVLLHYNTVAGHSGGRPVSEVIEDILVQIRFVIWQLDIDPSILAS